LSSEARVAARRKHIAPLVNDLIDWMKRERAKLSRHNEVAKAMNYMQQGLRNSGQRVGSASSPCMPCPNHQS
jgi:hypothetical protein